MHIHITTYISVNIPAITIRPAPSKEVPNKGYDAIDTGLEYGT
jgi:hypothetical protein